MERSSITRGVRNISFGKAIWLLILTLSGLLAGSLFTPATTEAAVRSSCESDRCVMGLFCTNAPAPTGCDVEDAFPQLCVTYDCQQT